MYGVTDLGGIEFLERENRVVLVLLSSNLYPSTIDWICRAWEEIHSRSARDWHLVVPTKNPINGRDGQLLPDNFSWSVSEGLRHTYGLPSSSIPCLVLDNFRDDQRQHFISLPASEEDRAKLVSEVEQFIRARLDGGNRQSQIDDLFDHLQKRAAWNGLLKIAPIVGSGLARFLGSRA